MKPNPVFWALAAAAAGCGLAVVLAAVSAYGRRRAMRARPAEARR